MHKNAKALGRPAVTAMAILLVAGCSSGSSGAKAPKRSEGVTNAAVLRPVPADLAPIQTLAVNTFSQPGNFDPARLASTTTAGAGLGRQYSEALLKPDAAAAPPYKVIGAAAQSYDVSADGLTYTFHLRPTAKYNDGQVVKAADFVYGWRRVIDPRTAAPFGRIFASVVRGGDQAFTLGPKADGASIDAALDGLGLKAADDLTFVVTTSRVVPYMPWIATLVQGAPVRRDVVERFGDAKWGTKVESLVTNGPFKVSEINADTTVLVPNPSYWAPVRLQKLVAYFGLDAATRWTKFLNNEIDISNGPPKASQDAVLADPQFTDQEIKFPELSTVWLQFNTRKAPFDNPQVRLAIAQAIDRDAFIKVSSNLSYRALTTLVPEGVPGFHPELGAPQQFDPVKAKATLAASGVSVDQIGPIEIITGVSEEPDAQFFKDQLQRNLGLSVTVTPIADGGVLNGRLSQGNYQLRTTFIGHSANYPDPQDFFDVFLTGSPDNSAGWSNPDYDRLVTQADAAPDDKQRLGLYDQAQDILVKQAPVVFLSQLIRNYFVKPWVGGITRTPIDTAWMPGDFFSQNYGIAKH